MASEGGGNVAGDIEEQFPDNVAATASANFDHPNAHASSVQQNPNDISMGQNHVGCSKGFLAKPISLLRTLFTTIIPRFLQSIENLWFWIIMFFASVVLCLYYILIKGSTKFLYYDGYTPDGSEEDSNKKKDSGIKMKKAAIKVKVHRLAFVTAVRTGFLLLLWMMINLLVPKLRRVRVLGSLLWKWSLLASLILLVRPTLMCLFYRITMVISQAFFTNKRQRDNVWYYMGAITEGLVLAMYFTSLLLTWSLCVDTTNPQLHRYGTLTLVSLLVGGVLSLLKSLVLLWWKTTLIYIKYKEKILSAGCHLYFNLLLMDQQYSDGDKLVSWLSRDEYTPKEFVPVDPKSNEIEDHKGHPSRHKILPIEEYMLTKCVSIEKVHTVATQLTKNFELSLTEDDDIPDIAPYMRRKFHTCGHGSGSGGLYSLSLHPFLNELLRLETSKKDPPYEDFEKMMVDGLKYSYAVGNRIDGAFEVMRILNRVMTAFIVVVVILVWLFITGLATTKVVVGLASVFLGLTFVFGDACKTFFQGVIFSFVTHPFDVADRCVIDDKELKVKKINILTTTFFGSQSKEIVLYPNSILATKHIMLLHGERETQLQPKHKEETEATSDLMDFVDFNLPPQTTSLQIESLEDTIERHMESGFESGVYKNSYYVSVTEFGDSVKMRVSYEHVLSDRDNIEHSRSIAMRKHKQRSRLIIQLKKFVEDLGK